MLSFEKKRLPVSSSLLGVVVAKKKSWCANWLEYVPGWFSWLGILSLMIYATTRMTTSTVGSKVEMLVIFSGYMAWLLYGQKLRKSKVFWLLIASVVIPLISWLTAHALHPQWAVSSPKILRLTYWFYFVPVALWLGGRTKNTLFIWGLALCGILLAPWLTGGGWSEWQRGLVGQRIDFDLHNAQHAAMLYGTGVLGLVSFSSRCFSFAQKGKWFVRFLWFTAFIICCLGVLVTQSRGVWLGLCGASLFFVSVLFWIFWKKIHFVKLTIILFVFVGLIALAMKSPLENIVHNRISSEDSTIIQLYNGNIDDIPYDTNIGIRVHSWIEACSWIKQRPLVGWGGKGRKLVIQQSKNFPDWVKKEFRHLHNSYLDTLVNFGMLGGSLFVGLLMWLVAKGKAAWKSGYLPGDMFIFFLGFLTFWLIINCFESYMFFSSGTFVFALLCGGVLTHIWKHDIERIK